MKIKKMMDVYVCDCCGKEMVYSPGKLLNGANYGSSGVTFEPKVFGDYCDTCLTFAQDDWDVSNTGGFVSERYDKVDEDTLVKEIEGIKLRKKECDEMDEYGRLYR